MFGFPLDFVYYGFGFRSQFKSLSILFIYSLVGVGDETAWAQQSVGTVESMLMGSCLHLGRGHKC